jgi:hypothetical protein
LGNTPNACHPERSLATSEANRQTQSKDPLHGGAAKRPRACTWMMSILLTFLLLLPIMSFGQAVTRFPGLKSELASPDRRWVLQNLDRDQEPHHSILLKSNATGKTRKICDYERHASVIWSPDSRYFALNDYAGSDFSDASIISVDETVSTIKVQDEILRKGGSAKGGDQENFGVARWLDARRVVVHNWGHGEPAPGVCICYVYALNDSVQKCVHQPKGAGLEELCSKTTP